MHPCLSSLRAYVITWNIDTEPAVSQSETHLEAACLLSFRETFELCVLQNTLIPFQQRYCNCTALNIIKMFPPKMVNKSRIKATGATKQLLKSLNTWPRFVRRVTKGKTISSPGEEGEEAVGTQTFICVWRLSMCGSVYV